MEKRKEKKSETYTTRPLINKNRNWKFFTFKLPVVIFMFKIFNSVLNRLVRMTFNGLTNANRSILAIKTMNTLPKTLYRW